MQTVYINPVGWHFMPRGNMSTSGFIGTETAVPNNKHQITLHRSTDTIIHEVWIEGLSII
jgi:hypothetical protein